MSFLLNPYISFPASGGGGDFDYTDLIMRQRADSITGKSTGDALTAAWADMTGNGRHWNVTTAPTYRASDGPNSKPCIRFDAASNQYLTGPDFSALTATEVTVYIVVKKVADPAPTAAKSGFWNLSGRSDVFGLCLVPFTDGTCIDSAFTGGTRSITDFATTLAQWNLYYVKNAHAVSSGFNHYLNGVAGNPQTNSVIWPATTYLGRSTDGSNNWFADMDVAEFGVFQKKITGAQEAGWKSYISTYYGLTIS